VESNHGQFRGAALDAAGQSRPPILGIALNGVGTALIRDTDDGRLDQDAVFDRAVGPMQFIPSTWVRYAVDGNGDGREDPFNIYDAARAAADYLCAAGGDLSTDAGKVRAVLAYNHSASYVATILALAATYEGGVAPTLPAIALEQPPSQPPANPGIPPAIGTESTPAALTPAAPTPGSPAPTSTDPPSPATTPASTSDPASTTAPASTTTPESTTPASTSDPASTTTPASTTPASTSVPASTSAPETTAPPATTPAASTPATTEVPLTEAAPTTPTPVDVVTSAP
jgi:hypothetical protein